MKKSELRQLIREEIQLLSETNWRVIMSAYGDYWELGHGFRTKKEAVSALQMQLGTDQRPRRVAPREYEIDGNLIAPAKHVAVMGYDQL